MIEGAVRKLWRRVQAAVAPGRIFLTDDTDGVQTAQMRTGPGELVDGVPVLQHFGFASRAPDDTLAVAIFAGGDRGQGVIVGTNHPASRLKNLEKGEAALYDDQGRWIWIKRDTIEIEAGGKDVEIKGAGVVKVVAETKVRLETPTLEVTGDISCDGTVTGATDVVGGGKSLKSHVHSGVQAGGANTGAPV